MTDLILQTLVNDPIKHLSARMGFSPDMQAGIRRPPFTLSNRSPPP
ncbi:MAG: hypothetical protein Q9O24_13130 [Gammaproteobacteria bacterium]|nr:hypothetical protein [Gammaproteobacteria bacterium]